MFTKTFRHTPGPELLGNAVVLFAIGVSLQLIEGVVVNIAVSDPSENAARVGLIISLAIRIPAYILYFVAALMGLLGIVASGIDRAAAARRTDH